MTTPTRTATRADVATGPGGEADLPAPAADVAPTGSGRLAASSPATSSPGVSSSQRSRSPAPPSSVSACTRDWSAAVPSSPAASSSARIRRARCGGA